MSQRSPAVRIPDVGLDGLRRLECARPHCRKLLGRFGPNLRGGPLEIQCTRPSCKHINTYYFNEAPPDGV